VPSSVYFFFGFSADFTDFSAGFGGAGAGFFAMDIIQIAWDMASGNRYS